MLQEVVDPLDVVVRELLDLRLAPPLLVVADGSARRTEKAPGHLDPRAAAVDDALVDALSSGSEDTGEIALVLGLLFALLSMTTAMAQVERGSNRIYGIRRDLQRALLDDGYRGELECITAKVFATEALTQAVVGILLKTHGGRAFLDGNFERLADHMRNQPG